MRRLRTRRSMAIAVLLVVIVNAVSASSAHAHVKWFCAFDIAGQPRGLERVLCLNFEGLVVVSLLALIIGSLVETTRLGNLMLRVMDRATHSLHDNTELLFRAGCGFFFVAIWAIGGVLLTPELNTDSVAVAALQLAIGAGMVSRRSMPLSALGIAILYAIAVRQYGFFHLADYPVFLGVAAYLALMGLQRDLLGARPIDVVRWTASITLMWASIEKWAYPEWSFSLLIEHPDILRGYDPEFFMRASGAVEFALAFALMWTPLVRRIAATILVVIFISAVFEFGKIDLIGHTLIVVVLLAIVADRGGTAGVWRNAWLVPIAYSSALSGFLAVYYVGHAMSFDMPIA